MGNRLMLNRLAAEDDKQAMVRLDGNIQFELTSLDTDIKAHMDYTHWKDTARHEYDAQQKIWNDAAEAMRMLLGQSHATLGNMLDNIDMTEDVNRRSWQNVYG